MKTFIYTTQTTKTNYNGNRTRTFIVYRVKNNKPEQVAEFEECLSCYAGDVQTVKDVLLDLKQISKREHATRNAINLWEV